jgi:predicted metal-dependent hydrolase
MTKEFNEAINILIDTKPDYLNITKALEELGELSVKLLQHLNKPESITEGDIEEEIVDVEMHLIMLNHLFPVNDQIRAEKIKKFLDSKDFNKYKKEYEYKKNQICR